jgi:hypothetical protein
MFAIKDDLAQSRPYTEGTMTTRTGQESRAKGFDTTVDKFRTPINKPNDFSQMISNS